MPAGVRSLSILSGYRLTLMTQSLQETCRWMVFAWGEVDCRLGDGGLGSARHRNDDQRFHQPAEAGPFAWMRLRRGTWSTALSAVFPCGVRPRGLVKRGSRTASWHRPPGLRVSVESVVWWLDFSRKCTNLEVYATGAVLSPSPPPSPTVTRVLFTERRFVGEGARAVGPRIRQRYPTGLGGGGGAVGLRHGHAW
jgi:hypothetical protein